MTIKDKIELSKTNKKYCVIKRKITENHIESNDGFIVDSSDNFIVFQEIDDFIIRGYLIIPISFIDEIRHNKKDIFFEKIYKKEGITEKIDNKHNIDLLNWETIFKSILKLNYNVIIKNEDPDDETFDIGPIIKVTKKNVSIRYFDATGILDNELTKIKWEDITLVNFDDIYINTMSKYLKEKK